MMRLAGRKALITGAASGIGRETAHRFAAEGAALALLDRDETALKSIADEIGAIAICCDLADLAAIAPAVDRAADALSGLDALINAAGILVRQTFETIDAALWQRLFDVNLRGLALVCQAALPALRATTGSSIVNIASLSALKPSPGTSAYAATKAGVLMLSKCLADELAPIRVNAICPGIIDTAMTAGFMGDPATRNKIVAANALHMIGLPADIAAACVYLTSFEARFVTGTQLVVDGGSSFS
jgi:NAD(P)-dependent dehydrogenase (short-subunit alcohol dehydrogenase family)